MLEVIDNFENLQEDIKCGIIYLSFVAIRNIIYGKLFISSYVKQLLKGRIMKKRLEVLAIMLICFAQLCACGNSSNVNINGIVIGDGNVVVINGENVVDNSKNSQTKKFDETKVEEMENIKKIFIDSDIVEVNVTTVSNDTKAKAHLYGTAKIDNDLELVMKSFEDELRISIEYNGVYKGNLKLDVMIPDKLFDEISIETVSADIKLNDAFAELIEANTKSGDIGFSTNAKTDIHVKFSSVSGNIVADFNNVNKIELYAKSVSGNVEDKHDPDIKGYSVQAYISTVSGNVNVK